jgi:hypothetical protein
MEAPYVFSTITSNTPNSMVEYKGNLCVTLAPDASGFLKSAGTDTTSFTHIGKTFTNSGGTACGESSRALVV